jgi:hypothetical protein
VIDDMAGLSASAQMQLIRQAARDCGYGEISATQAARAVIIYRTTSGMTGDESPAPRRTRRRVAERGRPRMATVVPAPV